MKPILIPSVNAVLELKAWHNFFGNTPNGLCIKEAVEQLQVGFRVTDICCDITYENKETWVKVIYRMVNGPMTSHTWFSFTPNSLKILN